MTNEWPKYEKRNWPEGSLERHLAVNYPGCKTLKEAMEVKRLRNQISKADVNPKPDDTAAQAMEIKQSTNEKPDDFEW